MRNELSRLIARCVVAFGIGGFLLAFALASFPSDWLALIELPNTLSSVRVTAQNGRVFVASVPLGRVQRYGPDGFERGFSVDARGGFFDIGVTRSGDVLICSARAHALIVYTQDGIETSKRLPCKFSDANGGHVPGSAAFYESNAQVPRVALGWLGLLAVPLWHPVVGWLVGLIGGLFLKYGTTRPGQDALSQTTK
ncbi:MAG: hypothetical protein WA418_12980 [Bradyrhizobium sp.]